MTRSSDAVTIGAAIAELTALLTSAGVEAPRVNAEWILCDGAGISKVDLFAHPESVLDPRAWASCRELARRRANREPIQYILGYTEFYGLRIAVTPNVLIPRPETEELVEDVLTRIADVANPRVLDVGTGSGCIVAAIGTVRPDARLFACDSEAAALRVAARNAQDLGVRVNFFRADALRAGFAVGLAGVVDVIVANPPYVGAEELSALEPEVRDHEPRSALVAGPDSLVYYRSLAREAGRVLRASGHLVVECHQERTAVVRGELASRGFVEVTERLDLAGKPRIVAGRVPRFKSTEF